ncbi:MAG TPA: 1,6-anhydro-N-acetylmuramyl-L-alanine amidase AmpD [Gammaproteobacteria bacterium]|nr:1,6-anhydro-N-acetylmuramyl-L-alanine amidase AmpD [Gammaproteobacteria bacterium]
MPDGLLIDARYISSPHCDARPDYAPIDLIVMHGISLPPAQFNNDSIEKFFLGELDFTVHPYFETIKHLKVSSHLLIKRSGEIIQFVPFSKRAWHAGESSFEGRERCNDFSIGIELEGTDDLSYEEIQYKKLAKIIKALQKSYPSITHSRITGHSDVAPGRKTDPGASFDWNYLYGLLRWKIK